MNFIMIGLLLREALDRLCVRLNMYLGFLYYLLSIWFDEIKMNKSYDTKAFFWHVFMLSFILY